VENINAEVQSDMKIDVRITWMDILSALAGWVSEGITAPLRWFRATKPQATYAKAEVASAEAK